jgi:hypothetical protein
VRLHLKENSVNVGPYRRAIGELGRRWNLKYNQVSQLLASLYLWSGSDYTSHFYDLPQNKWFEILYEEEMRNFIFGDPNETMDRKSDAPYQIHEDVFLRLVGSLYMKKYRNIFIVGQDGMHIKPCHYDYRVTGNSLVLCNATERHQQPLSAKVFYI